jgi:short-chain fatty acids transporter
VTNKKEIAMLRALSRPAVRLVERYLPDPFVFVLILTLVAAAAAILVEGASPQAVMRQWGDGFWGLLTFSMQMLLVLVAGYILASSPPVKKILARLAGLTSTAGGAIILVTVVSLAASWINWGFGLVVGALFAKMLESETESRDDTPNRPAEYLENSRVLMWLVGAPGVLYLLDYFLIKGGSLNLNIVNFTFLFGGILLHGTARHLLDALQEGVKGGAGIVIQFPFYAGIMAIMTQSGLAQSMSEWFVSISTAATLPFWSFISAGVVNMFVPSGGGQWAVQAPVMMPAAEALGADVARVAMAVAWGDAWTNLLQPFWALPMLGIAGLKAKDIMGFCLIQLAVTGVIIGVLLSIL